MLATIGGSGHCGTPELWSKLVQAPMLVGGTNGGAQGVVHQLPPPPLIIVLCPTTSITYGAHPGNGHSRSAEICSPFCG